MNLYLVTCVYNPSAGSMDYFTVYVVASSPTEAEQNALDRMRILQYKFSDFVSKVELLASVNTYRAETLLVLPN